VNALRLGGERRFAHRVWVELQRRHGGGDEEGGANAAALGVAAGAIDLELLDRRADQERAARRDAQLARLLRMPLTLVASAPRPEERHRPRAAAPGRLGAGA
jgi:hypothetical protein